MEFSANEIEFRTCIFHRQDRVEVAKYSSGNHISKAVMSRGVRMRLDE